MYNMAFNTCVNVAFWNILTNVAQMLSIFNHFKEFYIRNFLAICDFCVLTGQPVS